MPKTQKLNNTNCWLDQNGIPVPVKYIDQQVQTKEKLIEKLIDKANKLHQKLQNEKATMEAMIQDYLFSIAENYNEEWKGNAELINFDQTMKILIKINETIQFDENLQLAKALIDRCINKWSEKSDMKLATLIKHSFKTDKKGKIKTQMILSLKQYKFDDEDWNKAMQIISKSVTVTSSKTYYSFLTRDKETEWKQIALNFSSI